MLPSILTRKTREKSDPKIFAISDNYEYIKIPNSKNLFYPERSNKKTSKSRLIQHFHFQTPKLYLSFTTSVFYSIYHTLGPNRIIYLFEQIFILSLKYNRNKNIQKFRSKIIMQFVSFPISTILRPKVSPIFLPQIMSYALAADFKKYALAYVLNDILSSEKDEKKFENADTSIYTSSFQEIIQEKVDLKAVEPYEKNRKTQDSIQVPQINEEILESKLPRKRQSFEKARCQITQAFESSQESKQDSEKEESEKQEEQITYKNKIKNKNVKIKLNKLKKQKKIQKAIKFIKALPIIEPEEKLLFSTTVSLIDTIDQPKITIDRFQIEKKRQSLLSRAVVYDEFLQKRYTYQIRERREIKRLN